MIARQSRPDQRLTRPGVVRGTWFSALSATVLLGLAGLPAAAQTTGTRQTTAPASGPPSTPSATGKLTNSATTSGQTSGHHGMHQLSQQALEEFMLELLFWDFIDRGGHPSDLEGFLTYLQQVEREISANGGSVLEQILSGTPSTGGNASGNTGTGVPASRARTNPATKPANTGTTGQ